MDPIDSGTKVQILFKRLTDPEFAKREAEAKKRQVGVWLGENQGIKQQDAVYMACWGELKQRHMCVRTLIPAARCCCCRRCCSVCQPPQEQAAEEAAKANKKAGAWGGLPSRR